MGRDHRRFLCICNAWQRLTFALLLRLLVRSNRFLTLVCQGCQVTLDVRTGTDLASSSASEQDQSRFWADSLVLKWDILPGLEISLAAPCDRRQPYASAKGSCRSPSYCTGGAYCGTTFGSCSSTGQGYPRDISYQFAAALVFTELQQGPFLEL